MNRAQRRNPAKPANAPIEKMLKPKRPQDELDPRAKNSGHGKKTADKWNQ
jgi:hypothetical protein